MNKDLRKSLGLGLICALWMLVASNGWAQSDNTQISGYVKDSSGAVVPGVKVVVKSEGREFERSGVSSDVGYYTVTNLPPGFYTVSAELAGFKRFQSTHKKLDANIAATEDIVLQVGELSQTVSVEAAASAIQTDASVVGKLVDGKQIELLQLNGRNPLFLAMLKPGVNSGGGISQFNFGLTTGGLNINGSRTPDNMIYFDGAVAVRTRSNGISIGVADVDTVQEVQVMTANYSAEFGRSSGGQIRIVTKSGTRSLHGNAYEFFRNSALDANTWARNRANPAGDRSCSQYPSDQQCRAEPYRYNQFGYNASGPVYIPGLGFNKDRNKLFWLWGQEWVRYRRTNTVATTVPSLLMRQGNFSELLSSSNRFYGKTVLVNDPLTGKPFDGNIIPTARLSSNGIGLLKAFPEPTPGYIGPGTSNYTQDGPTWTNQRKDTLSIDFYPTERHSIRWRAQLYHYIDYSWQRANTDRVPGGLDRPNQTTSLSWTWSLSPTLINEALATASRDQVHIYVDTSAGKYKRGLYGIDYNYIFPANKMIPDRIPTINTGFFTDVDGGPYPSSSAGPIYNFSDNITKIWGKHTLKAGFMFERAGQNDYDQINVSGVPGGTNNQNGRFEFRDVRPGGTGNLIGNMALGLFNSYAEIGTRSYTPYRGHMVEWFIQDAWKVTPKLRLEMGVRHSIIQPYYSLWGNMVVFDQGSYDPKIAVQQDPATGFIIGGDLKSKYNGLIFPGDGWPDPAKGRIPIASSGEYNFMFSGQSKSYSNTHFTNFQPRAGLAYAINNKMVLRAGIGRFLTRLGVSDSVFLGGNPPLQPMASISTGVADLPGGGANRAFPLPITTQDKDFPNPESWVWNVAFERQLPFETTLGVAYVGRRGLHAQRERDLNALQPGTIQKNPGINADFLRPYRGFSYIRSTNNEATSRYNALQLEGSRRFAKGFGFGVSYTWSKSSDVGSAQRDIVPNPFDTSPLWGPATYDRRHVLVINGMYDLPWFRGQRSLKGQVLGNWTMSFTSQFQTGTPFTVATGDDFAGVGGTSGPQIWVVNGDPKMTSNQQKFSENNSDGNFWFRTTTNSGTAMFTRPAAGTFNSQRVRDLLYNPGFQNHNFGIFKDFPVAEGQKVQFRFEAFNWMNHPNWSGANTTPTSASFGRVQGKGSERGLQFALRYTF